MPFNLDDKSSDYLNQLNKIVDKYRESNSMLIKIFCKYADAEFGLIASRKGLFTLLGETTVGLLIQDDLPYLILNPSAIYSAQTPELLGLDFRPIKREVFKEKLDSFDRLLYVKADPWYTSMGEVRSIWISSSQIWIRSIDPKLPGYSFDTFNLKQDWEDIYDKESIQST